MKLTIYTICGLLLLSAAIVHSEGPKEEEQQETETLWEQNDNLLGNSVPSQQFSNLNGSPTWQSADDFNIPNGETWTITQVTVYGRFTQVPSTDVEKKGIWNVVIYNSVTSDQKDHSTTDGSKILLPSNDALFSAEGLEADDSDLFQTTGDSKNPNAGQFGTVVINLPNSAQLNQGTYWLAVYPTLPENNLFRWQLTDDTHDSEFAVRVSPNLSNCNNFGGSWGTNDNCDEVEKLSGSGEDLGFVLVGTRRNTNLAEDESCAATLSAFWL